VTMILLVEDNPADALLIREALRQVQVDESVDVVTDGEQALERLRDGGEPRPDLVLLDLNLPRLDGRQVLATVKADPGLRDIPVIVMTTSGSPPDIAEAYASGANAYVRKPLGMERLVEAAASIRDFWLRSATLPTQA
jgi:two-component system, chemotaxis family, response regulator Rcp1